MSRMDKVQTNKMKTAASGKVLIVKGIAAFGAEFRRANSTAVSSSRGRFHALRMDSGSRAAFSSSSRMWLALTRISHSGL